MLKGVRRFLLVTAAITMGGIGIWGTHFVANRAILLEHGVLSRQILFNPGYTAVSFFLPTLVLLAAFFMLGIPNTAHYLYIAVAGILTGSAVCGMHYIGLLDVANYHCSYYIQNVVGSAVISVVASSAAFGIFFHLRDTWTDTWWKKALCGILLCCAVSASHWTASLGIVFEWKGNSTIHGDSKVQTSIIAFLLVS